MKLYKERMVTTKIIKAISCSVCKKVYDVNDIETEEFISIEINCGYNSIFEDGKRGYLDVCQHCLKNIFNEYIEWEE